MSDKEKTIHDILTATQTGTIVCLLARTLGVPVYEAFRRFFRSETYAVFRKPGSSLSMLGDPAIVREYLVEIGREGLCRGCVLK